MKVDTKRMILKLSGKFEWHTGVNYWWVDLPSPRNVRYTVHKLAGADVYTVRLERLEDRFGRIHGNDLTIGNYTSLQAAQDRAELREARYEVKQATMAGRK